MVQAPRLGITHVLGETKSSALGKKAGSPFIEEIPKETAGLRNQARAAHALQLLILSPPSVHHQWILGP